MYSKNDVFLLQVPHTLYPYDHYLQAVASMSSKATSMYQAGYQAGMNSVQQQLGKTLHY